MQPGGVPPASRSARAGRVVSGTVMPTRAVVGEVLAGSSASSPYAPYSFSTWTTSTGPPRSIWGGTTARAGQVLVDGVQVPGVVAAHAHRRVGEQPGGQAAVVPFRADVRAGRTIAYIPASATSRRKRPRSSPPETSNGRAGACRFHGTYVSMVLRPIRRALRSRSAHWSGCTRK